MYTAMSQPSPLITILVIYSILISCEVVTKDLLFAEGGKPHRQVSNNSSS